MMEQQQQKAWWQRPATLITLVVVVVVSLLGVIGVSWVNGINNDGISRQNDVVTQYRAVETTLSTCLDNSMQAAGIAVQERNSLKDILVGTASARYENPDGTISTDIPANAAVALNAIREAYPAVSDALFQQLMTTVVGCRNEVSGAQQKLQALGNRFLSWTQTGSIFEKPTRGNYPDARLVVIGPGGEKLYGADALAFIVTPITVQDAKTAMTNKVMPSQQLFPSVQPTG